MSSGNDSLIDEPEQENLCHRPYKKEVNKTIQRYDVVERTQISYGQEIKVRSFFQKNATHTAEEKLKSLINMEMKKQTA